MWVSCVFSACGTVHLHNAERETAAAAAKADYDASKYGEAIKAQRAVLMSLEQSEIAASRKYIHALRDTALIGLVKGSELPKEIPTPATGFIARFNAKVDARLIVLDGDERRQAHLDGARADRMLERGRRDEARLRRSLANQHVAMKELPACGPAWKELDRDGADAKLIMLVNKDGFSEYVKEAWGEGLQTEIGLLVKACADIASAETRLSASAPKKGGLLAGVVAERDSERNRGNDLNGKAVNARTELKAASAELAAVSKKLNKLATPRDYTCPAVSPSAIAKEGEVKAVPIRLCNALSALDRLGPVGKKIIAEEKVERIGAILSAMSGVTPKASNDSDVDSALAFIAAATRIGHALDQYHQAATWPPLEPLIIEKQLANAQLASAAEQVELSAARLTYYNELVEATKQEIVLLGRARSTMTGYGVPKVAANAPCAKYDPLHCESLEALLASTRRINGTPEERVAYRAMALLSESYVARDRQRTAQVRLNASGYQEALILAEEALASWKAILDTPIEQLRTYHAGGLKPAELAPLLQALGVLGIANGVN